MLNQKLVSYVQEGVNRGFSPDHLREVLKKYNYSDNDIDAAIAIVKKPQIKKPGLNHSVIFGAAAAVLILAVALIASFSKPNISGAAITEEEYRGYFEKINALTEEVDARDAKIRAQFEALNAADISLEEKEALVKSQIGDLTKLYDSFAEERAEIRNALMDLTKVLFEDKK